MKTLSVQELLIQINNLSIKTSQDKLQRLEKELQERELEIPVIDYCRARKHIHTVKYCKKNFK